MGRQVMSLFMLPFVFCGCGAGGTSLADVARDCEIFPWSESEEDTALAVSVVIIAARSGIPKSAWEGDSRRLCSNGSTCGGLFPEGPPPDCASDCVACIDTLWSYGCEQAGELCSG